MSVITGIEVKFYEYDDARSNQSEDYKQCEFGELDEIIKGYPNRSTETISEEQYPVWEDIMENILHKIKPELEKRKELKKQAEEARLEQEKKQEADLLEKYQKSFGEKSP